MTNFNNPNESRWLRPRPHWGWITLSSQPWVDTQPCWLWTTDLHHISTSRCAGDQQEGREEELRCLLCLSVHTQHGKLPDWRQTLPCNDKSLSSHRTARGPCSWWLLPGQQLTASEAPGEPPLLFILHSEHGLTPRDVPHEEEWRDLHVQLFSWPNPVRTAEGGSKLSCGGVRRTLCR